MKLERIFTVKKNKLYKISDNSNVNLKSLKQIKIKWSDVELNDEIYNEEFLANLRNNLKNMEKTVSYAVLVPVINKPLKSSEQTEHFINTFNHTARRIKDCTSVAGFELPHELTVNGIKQGTPASDFMETLAVKHEQYVYFTKDSDNIPDNIVKY